MESLRTEFCRDCKYCCKVHEVDSYSLFCENLQTKEWLYPIGFLSRDAQGCQYFQLATDSAARAAS